MADGRDLEHAEAARLEVGAHELGEIVRLGHVDLVERDELRALEQRQLALGHGVGGELGEDHVEVGQRVAAGLERRAVEHVHERRAALDVAEELEAEPLALARALDEPGHVGDGEADVAGLHDAEVRVERRERVVGDLRAARPRSRR